MKKYLPYIIGLLALIVLLILIIASPLKIKRELDERLTLQKKDKIPYGTYVSFQLLQTLFPKAVVQYSNKASGPWHSAQNSNGNDAVFLIAKTFDPNLYDLQRMAAFAKQGNYVFIIAYNLSYRASKFLKMESKPHNLALTSIDSLRLHLNNPPFAQSKTFAYPGKKLDGYFSFIDGALNASVAGTDNTGAPDFVQLNIGLGKIFVNLAPVAFSNYFLLHKSNIGYYQRAMSLIPETVNTVYWNEYYLLKPRDKKETRPNALSVMLKYPSFRAALFTALCLLLLYVLLEMRRRQRMIPIVPKSVNDSLDFVKTIGRLYYDRKDHLNLSKKMAAYFLEHIRSHYKLQSTILNDEFVASLHVKTGYPVPELEKIISFINYLDHTPMVTEEELNRFYHHLELFYQNT